MVHPQTELRLSKAEIGLGLFATHTIPCGTITWARDPLDQVIPMSKWLKLPPLLQADIERHTWRNEDGNAVLCWDLARFVNHSCNPNCLSTALGFEIAVRDIAAGEELTNDYANLGMYEHERLQCHCGFSACRGLIEPADAARLKFQWSGAIESAWRNLLCVEQPLWSLLSTRTRASSARIPALIMQGAAVF